MMKKLSRLPYTLILAGAALILAACTGRRPDGQAAGYPAEGPPNVVILYADDMGWNSVGFHGSEIRTPNLDRLAEEGTVLDRFYVSPICSPSRVSLLTGRYAHRSGMAGNVVTPWGDEGLSPEEVLLPEMLAERGYTRRGIFGKWHLGQARREYHPLAQGFTHFYGHLVGAIDYFTHERMGELDWHRDWEPSYDEGYTTELIGREAVNFIKDRDPDHPFLAYVAFNAPHSPFQAPAEELAAYDFSADLPETEKTYRTYAAMVSSLDAAVGRILDALDEEGIADRTIVLFASDNGGVEQVKDSNEPLRGHKFTVYEGGVRSPAILRWPERVPAGGICREVLAHIDVFPTLGAAAGAGDFPERVDGLDMIPVINGTADSRSRMVYLTWSNKKENEEEGIVSRDWKWISGQLYRIEEDPNETTDVSAGHPEVLETFERAHRDFKELQNPVLLPPYATGRKDFSPPANWQAWDD